jgi:hypothetical protein
VFRAYGITVGVRTNDPLMVEELRSRLPFGARPSRAKRVDFLFSFRVGPQVRSGVRSFHLLYSGASRTARSLQLSDVLEAFADQVQLTVAEHSRSGLFVHAGVVEWNGSAILIPGRSFSGKSTLTLSFIRAGARYYSDEYAIIDRNGRIRPYSRTISIRRGNGTADGFDVPVETGRSAATRAIPVGWIIETEFRSGSRWRPRTMTPGEAFLSLLANTVAARRRTSQAFAILPHVVKRAVRLKGVRGEADDLVRELLGGSASAQQQKHVPLG